MLAKFAMSAVLAAALSAPAIAGNFAATLLPSPVAASNEVQRYIKVPAGQIALRHVRIIDGTGAATQQDRTILIVQDRIRAVQDDGAPIPSGYKTLDLAGSTVLPGIVGMHDHIFHIARPNLEENGHFDSPLIVPQMTFAAPRLYLANGVTTIRTTGSVEPYTDLNLKHAIDKGELPGPHMDVTGPYLEGATSPFIVMHRIQNTDDARRTVAFWADEGATSFKAYMNITRGELKAAIDEAHRRGLKITGHLCAVTYDEAADLGIDNLEHGFFVNTANDPGRQPDVCPSTVGAPTIENMDPDGLAAKALIAHLISRHVAVTSTLPAFEPLFDEHSSLYAKSLEAMSREAREGYLLVRRRLMNAPEQARKAREKRWRNDLALERKFVDAGGLLMSGPDPTSTGGIVPGYGDLRGIELLVEAGFTPLEAVKIATLNGAIFLGVADRIGSIAPGKNADLIIVQGDPSQSIADIEQVQLVFKDGVGYDPDKLVASVKGHFGQY
ncbi:MAG: amidohydrolase family protein [Alphaproteobacteria bacterium]|nr:amidohydrolase family protein [Alphaproteobacteria bacterium]